MSGAAHWHGLVHPSIRRSRAGLRAVGLALLVLAILVSACVAGYESVHRLIDPQQVDALGALAAAGAVGFVGNLVAAWVRTRAGRRLDSPASPGSPGAPSAPGNNTNTTTKGRTMSTTSAPEQREQGPPADPDYQPPRLKFLLAGIVVALAAVGVILLFGGGSSEPSKPASAQDLPFVDGTLVVADETRLVMRPFDGGAEVQFTIRPEDVGNFDIAHLQSHSSVGIPTRIYYDEEGGTKYAVYKEDAPVNSQR